MTKVILQRAGRILLPVGEDSVEAILGFKDGAEIMGILRGARNLEQLKLFWSLAGIVAESMDLPKETIKKDAAIALGFTETWIDHDGRIHVDPKSIAVESMTQGEFDQFFQKAVNLMAGWINADHKDLMRRFNELAADKRYIGLEHR